MKNNKHQHDIIMKTTYQTFLDMLETELKNKAKGVFPALHSVSSSIENMTNGRPFSFPRCAKDAGAEVKLKDCSNLLHLYFDNVQYHNNARSNHQLSDVLFGEGSTANDMKAWLHRLNIVDSNGRLCESYILDGCAILGCGKNVYLTRKGLELIEAARHIYRTVGYKLMGNECLTQTKSDVE